MRKFVDEFKLNISAQMSKYYIEIKEDSMGNNTVHKEDCIHLPEPVYLLYFGLYFSSEEAIQDTQKRFPAAKGCWYCSREC